MRRTPGVFVVLVALGLLGCKEEKKEDKTAESAAKTSGSEASSEGKPAANVGKRTHPRPEGLSARIGLEPVTVDEIRPMIPVLAGVAQPVVANATAGGRRVTSMQCVEATDLAKVKAELEGLLTKLGYTNIRGSSTARGDLITMSGAKEPYRMSATLRIGPYPDCPADQKKLKVLMSFFKRAPRPPGAPGAPAMPGAPAATAPSAPAPAAPTTPAPTK